jgi:hypothetical protein
MMLMSRRLVTCCSRRCCSSCLDRTCERLLEGEHCCRAKQSITLAGNKAKIPLKNEGTCATHGSSSTALALFLASSCVRSLTICHSTRTQTHFR